MTQQITAQLLKGGLTVDASGNISATKLIGDLQGNVTGDLTGNADTATTATTADSADTLNQQTSINLSGTYSTHQLLVADAYALTGDVTVNDNLILGKLSDDGNDILIEGNYTFTSTGAGKVEAGYVTSSGISADSLTGTLGSGVTLGSGATIDSGVTGTLGSGVSFPAGHVIQVSAFASTTTAVTITNTWADIGLTQTITPSSSSSKILVLCQIAMQQYRDAVESFGGIGLQRNGTDIFMGTSYESVMEAGTSGGGRTFLSSMNPVLYLDTAHVGGTITYNIVGRAAAGQCTYQTNSTVSSMLLMEIQA